MIAALESVIRGDVKESATAAPTTRISDTEAHAVWQRAADLQALTGTGPRPDLPPRARDADKDRVRTSGFSMTDVRSAANQAGISDSYVERALSEHGLLARRQTPVNDPLPRTALRRSLWAGAPLDVVVDADVDTAVDPRRFERLINTLREGTGTVGVTTTKSRELIWRGAWFGHRLEASVAPDGDRTRIRLSQSIRRAALTTMSAAVAGGGVIGTAVAVSLVALMRLPAPFWSIRLHRHDIINIATTAGICAGLLLIPIGRAFVRRLRDYNSARLQTLTNLLALRAGDGRDD